MDLVTMSPDNKTKGEVFMYKKYLNVVLPIFGALVIVGSGFSAWIFNQEKASADGAINGTISMTNVVELDNASVSVSASKFDLTLDQGGMFNTDNDVGLIVKTYDEQNRVIKDESGNDKTTISITYTLNTTNNTTAFHSKEEAIAFWSDFDKAYQFNYTISMDLYEGESKVDDLTNCPIVLPSEVTSAFNSEENRYFISNEAPYTCSYAVEYDLANFTYKNKPTNYEEYNAMKTYLTGKTLKASIHVTKEDKVN